LHKVKVNYGLSSSSITLVWEAKLAENRVAIESKSWDVFVKRAGEVYEVSREIPVV
jgi:hypothetical protein